MYLLGYSLDNLSLMALTISTGFVVDDAIVVIENITRHLEQGMAPLRSRLRGAREIGFTVLSISISLVAVFIPILMMGGFVGRLFREFAVTLSFAIGVSMVVSLTTTPMMCARFLSRWEKKNMARLYNLVNAFLTGCLRFMHDRLLMGAAPPTRQLLSRCSLPHQFYLYRHSSQGIFSPAGHRTHFRGVQAQQNISFPAMMRRRLPRLSEYRDEGSCRRDHGGRFAGRYPAAQSRDACSSALSPLEVTQNDHRSSHRAVAPEIGRQCRGPRSICSPLRT